MFCSLRRLLSRDLPTSMFGMDAIRFSLRMIPESRAILLANVSPQRPVNRLYEEAEPIILEWTLVVWWALYPTAQTLIARYRPELPLVALTSSTQRAHANEKSASDEICSVADYIYSRQTKHNPATDHSGFAENRILSVG